jgi:hypothetical protein
MFVHRPPKPDTRSAEDVAKLAIRLELALDPEEFMPQLFW